MHIIKGETRRFTDYEISITQIIKVPKKSFWKRSLAELLTEQPKTQTIETLVKGVVEADDHTGLLIVQEFDEFGNGLYTNGLDTISTDNAVKVLLLAPVFRTAFHQAGFRPKLSSSYNKNLKIRYNGPPLTQVVVKEEKPQEQELQQK